jgi:hypothetical protein
VTINAVQLYVKNLLDGLALPQGLNLTAYITPPDPNVETDTPTAYVWPADGTESRDPRRGGSIPRMTVPSQPSGTKVAEHMMDVWLVWFSANDDPDADTWFPGMVDAIMALLRVTAVEVDVYDPYSNAQSVVIDTGEQMTYKIAVSAVEDERYNRYDALITLRLTELFTA